MLHAEAYVHDSKARLHETLPKLAEEITERSGRRGIILDSFIISATPFKDIRKKYDDGKWDRKKFADAHILFMERNGKYAYIKTIFSAHLTKTSG